MNILLIGPQGSGKGTQAKILTEKLGLCYVEIGNLLRKEAEINPEVNQLINIEGKLAPDDITHKLATEKIEKECSGIDNILFDGFPRSIEQYEMISEWLKSYGKKVDVAILVDIPEEESIRRLSARRKCAKCGRVWNLVTSPKPPTSTTCECGGELTQRVDDKPEAIKKRLEIYKNTTGKLIQLLEEKGVLVRVDGTKSINEVTEDILEKLKNAY